METERRELLTVQGSRRATINTLEEQVGTLTDKLRSTTGELNHVQNLYSQLRLVNRHMVILVISSLIYLTVSFTHLFYHWFI